MSRAIKPIKGQKFGILIATGRWETRKQSKKFKSFYEVRCPHGSLNYVLRDTLVNQGSETCRRWRTCPVNNTFKTPEGRTVSNHFQHITNPSDRNKSYKGMIFFRAWDPRYGGMLNLATQWILKNLGKRPQNCTMHVIEHEKGFVPGNLMWTSARKQNSEQMFKIIAQLKHKIKQLEAKLERKNAVSLR